MRAHRLVALFAALSLTACTGHGGVEDPDDDGGPTDGATTDTGDPCIDIEPLSVTSIGGGLVCEMPTDCISLPEAVDRGAVAVSYSGAGLVVENIDADFDICMDGWYLFMSNESQDSGAGDPGDGPDYGDTGSGIPGIEDGGDDGSSSNGDDGGDGDDGSDGTDGDDDPCDDTDHVAATENQGGRLTLAPLQAISFGYGGNGGGLETDAPTWWCVEETQVTATTESFDFNGARMPHPLLQLALTETDLDGDGIEDHADGTQTNANIWAFQRENPVFAIGRDKNFVEMTANLSERVTLQITNMGRVADTIRFTETLPPGVEASNFSRRPVDIETTPRGWTILHWEATVDGAVDTATNQHTVYGMLEVSYDVSMRDGATCPLRHEGRSPQVRWDTDDARMWTSNGTALIVSCCARE